MFKKNSFNKTLYPLRINVLMYGALADPIKEHKKWLEELLTCLREYYGDESNPRMLIAYENAKTDSGEKITKISAYIVRKKPTPTLKTTRPFNNNRPKA